ncbi:unnamed protein product [Parnassius apollo]|uniref:(apollo) hypothetical protein n=1 Tax=Parnassius apollo TaxID=110799 RepID=A0A8S3XHM4_PARAO|nr:unnamed protein product [Parnassius apollo]
MEIDNITIRKRKTNDSFDCSFISHRSDCRRHSLPDLSIGYDSDTDELREEIKKLQKKLDSANGEIDNLNYEIYNLSKKLKDQQKTIENLKKLATESTTSTKKYDSTKKIVKRQLRKDNSLEELNKSFQELQIRNDSLTQSKQTETYRQIQEQYFQSTNNKCIKSQLLPQDDTASTQTNNLNKPTNKESKNNFEKKIFIIGSQQCVGLSSHLIISRQQSRYNKYNISSITKPYATAEEILKSCYKLQPNESNYVILCVGENDTTPTKLSIELSSALRLKGLFE